MHGPEREPRDERHDEAPRRAPASDAALLIQSIVDYAIFMLDSGGHVVRWNAGAERIKGYRAEDIIGRISRRSTRRRMSRPASRIVSWSSRSPRGGWRTRGGGSARTVRGSGPTW